MSPANILGCAHAQAQEPQREGETDVFALFIGAVWSPDKWSVPWDSSVDRPTVFLLLPEALRCQSLTQRGSLVTEGSGRR